MKTDIEFTQDLSFGDNAISKIEVKSLTFFEMVKLWKNASKIPGKAEVALQRARIQHQAYFLDSDGKRQIPSIEELYQMPMSIGKSIVDSLDFGQGKPGEIIGQGDGCTKPILYKLGDPISTKLNNKKVQITELEFFATTFGQVEEILAADSEMDRASALITQLAVPIEIEGLMQLPSWALDQLSTADGVTIMRQVLPAF